MENRLSGCPRLTTNDDDGSSLEARILWTAPADGDYQVALGDVAQRGEQDIYYRLALAPSAPSVQATIAAHSLQLEAGGPSWTPTFRAGAIVDT
ncbi:MAG: hypothetical protein ACKV19_27370 [Verrucomicrobiales bacterium]